MLEDWTIYSWYCPNCKNEVAGLKNEKNQIKVMCNNLKVNGLRYKSDSFTERYLSGGSAIVSYNPEDCGTVWLFENGIYTPFGLIENRYSGKSFDAVQKMAEMRQRISKSAAMDSLQGQIDLADHICSIADSVSHFENTKIKLVRETRKQEQQKIHRNYIDEIKPNV